MSSKLDQLVAWLGFCEDCGLPHATDEDEDRHEAEYVDDECPAKDTGECWCQELCWCSNPGGMDERDKTIKERLAEIRPLFELGVAVLEFDDCLREHKIGFGDPVKRRASYDRVNEAVKAARKASS